VAKDLPIGYYLDNFLTLLDWVDGQYADLLSPAERKFSEDFRRFGLDAQRLYVRLISRKGPLFRSDGLHYAEIQDVGRAVAELAKEHYISIDGGIPATELLELLTVSELVDLFSSLGPAIRKMKKPLLVRWIAGRLSSSRIRSLTRSRFHVYRPLKERERAIFRLLFFGNLSQNLVEFVLLDLGVIRYEAYPVPREARLFESRETVEKTLSLIRWEDRAYTALEQDNHALVEKIVAEMPDGTDAPGLGRRRDRMVNRIGRYYERKSDWHRALSLYRQSRFPPSRERQIRILEKLGCFEEALDISYETQREPYGEDEAELCQRYIRKLGKKLGYRMESVPKPDIQAETVALPFVPEQRIETAALRFFEERGWKGFYAENAFWISLFGLAFWDIVFLPIRGAFFNRYQRGPRDLFSPDFRKERERAIDARLVDIRNSESWQRDILALFDEKRDTANYLVKWNRITRAMLELALPLIARQHLVDIFDRLSRDIGGNKTGFPDLLLFPDSRSYELVEVKGPGDGLQRNQLRWMRYFNERGIPCKVLNLVPA
jgi:hypothetical protein